MDKLWTIDEAAALLRTNRDTLAQWRRKKKGPLFLRSGKQVLYRETALTAYMLEQEALQAAERASA